MFRALFRTLWDPESSTFTYFVGDPTCGEAFVIDPVKEHAQRDARLLRELNLFPKFVMNTHVHADHITGTGALKKMFKDAKSVLGSLGNEEAVADLKVEDGQVLRVGNQEMEVRSTPGHTQGCCSYVWRQTDSKNPIAIFTGDTLLVRGCGRTDFQGGSSERLYKSVWDKIFTLPDDTIVFPAHDYRGLSCSTIGEEKRFNPRLTKSLAEFEEIMANLRLSKPKKMDESIPSNLVCGLHDVIDDDGVSESSSSLW